MPVWSAFLALIPLGWEPLDEGELSRLAQQVAPSPHSSPELWRIFWLEIVPVWNSDWSEDQDQVLALCAQTASAGVLRRCLRTTWQVGMLLALVLLCLLPLSPCWPLGWRIFEVLRDTKRLIARVSALRERDRLRGSEPAQRQ